jgi:hypothetical protein
MEFPIAGLRVHPSFEKANNKATQASSSSVSCFLNPSDKQTNTRICTEQKLHEN